MTLEHGLMRPRFEEDKKGIETIQRPLPEHGSCAKYKHEPPCEKDNI